MTPKEKAKELFETIDYIVYGDINIRNQKDMALFCVDEIVKSHDKLVDSFEQAEDYIEYHNYWQEVKQEIERS